MAGLFPNKGLYNVLDDFAAYIDANGPLTMGLFKNDYTPDPNTDNDNFTEATYDGYARVTLTRGAPSIVGDGDAQLPFSAAAFPPANSGSEDEYGFFVLEPHSGILWAERFDSAPITVDTSFGIIITWIWHNVVCSE